MPDLEKQRSMLVILLATCDLTLNTMRVADNIVDEELISDIERMVERTRREIEALSTKIESGRA